MSQWNMLAVFFYVVVAAPLVAVILSAWVQLHEQRKHQQR